MYAPMSRAPPPQPKTLVLSQCRDQTTMTLCHHQLFRHVSEGLWRFVLALPRIALLGPVDHSPNNLVPHRQELPCLFSSHFTFSPPSWCYRGFDRDSYPLPGCVGNNFSHRQVCEISSRSCEKISNLISMLTFQGITPHYRPSRQHF